MRYNGRLNGKTRKNKIKAVTHKGIKKTSSGMYK
jgi:hypothetical protein